MNKIVPAIFVAIVIVIAVIFFRPQPHKVQTNFGNSSYYMTAAGAGIGMAQNQSIRENVLNTLLSTFYDKDTGLFYEFNQNGNFSAEKYNVFGPPYYFKEYGYDEISGFNAFVGNALLKNATHIADAKNLADAIHREFLDTKSGSYNILRSSGDYKGAVNDAIIGSFYLELYEMTGKEKYREWAKQVFDSIITNYVSDGKLNCCIVSGNLSKEMYTRDGLVVASFVYAYRVLGEEKYHETAKKIAENYIANYYKIDGYFEKWENAGTDAEIAFGLIELYKIDRDSRYRDILFSQFKYWSGRNVGVDPNISVVDEAEQFVFYVKMHELFDGNVFIQSAKSKWATIENCYSEKYGFPHVCKGDTYYSTINAIVLLAYV